MSRASRADALLDAALAAAARQPWHTLTLEQIADTAQADPGEATAAFADLDDLARALAEREATGFMNSTVRAVSAAARGGTVDSGLAALAAHLVHHTSRRPLLRCLLGGHDPQLAPVAEAGGTAAADLAGQLRGQVVAALAPRYRGDVADLSQRCATTISTALVPLSTGRPQPDPALAAALAPLRRGPVRSRPATRPRPGAASVPARP